MNFWHIFEIIIISIVIIVQIIHTIVVSINIRKLKGIFLYKLFLKKALVEKSKIGSVDFDLSDIYYESDLDENSTLLTAESKTVKVPLIDTDGENEIINRIKDTINRYLINNYGAAVNFSIIKDIVDREIEVKDEEITQSISLPLYLGLAATMTGIIFGLFSMPSLNGVGFQNGVDALIWGVKIAMIGSLCGLAFTTYLSSFAYKKAKRTSQKDKNEQLSYLQATLLPELIKAEDTGVSGLKASLDRFARVATGISDTVLIAANQTGENLELQREVIEKVENMEVIKVSKWNLELFEKMESNMDSFNKFSEYLAKMERITSHLLEFANKTSDVNKVINGIDSTLGESRDLTRFLTSHFEKIENSGDAALKSVGIVESHFEEAIKSLKERTEEMISQLYKSAGNHEASIENIYNDIQANLNSITSQYVDAFKDAYSDTIPKFNQLDNLELMKEINTSLNSLKQSQVLINKLNSIEESLKKRSSRSNGTNTKAIIPVQKIEVENSKETITLAKVIKKLF